MMFPSGQDTREKKKKKKRGICFGLHVYSGCVASKRGWRERERGRKSLLRLIAASVVNIAILNLRIEASRRCLFALRLSLLVAVRAAVLVHTTTAALDGVTAIIVGVTPAGGRVAEGVELRLTRRTTGTLTLLDVVARVGTRDCSKITRTRASVAVLHGHSAVVLRASSARWSGVVRGRDAKVGAAVAVVIAVAVSPLGRPGPAEVVDAERAATVRVGAAGK